MDATRNGLMLFSFTDEEQTNQAWLFENLSAQLSRCSHCVENYYIQRNKLRQLLDSYVAHHFRCYTQLIVSQQHASRDGRTIFPARTD